MTDRRWTVLLLVSYDIGSILLQTMPHFLHQLVTYSCTDFFMQAYSLSVLNVSAKVHST